MADAERIIEEERVREERRARKKKRKAAKMKKKRSTRRSGGSEFEKEPEIIKSQTPRLETSESDLREMRTPVAAASPMQEASVSPISATVSSAREEHAAAIAESASPLKYPRRRSEAVMAVSTKNEGASAPVAEPPMKPIVVAKAVVTSPLAKKNVPRPVEPTSKVINSTAQKKSGGGVSVNRGAKTGIRIDESKVRHNEFHEATVLVTSLAHLHRSSTNRDAAKKKAAPPPKTQNDLAQVRGRKRANVLRNASKAW